MPIKHKPPLTLIKPHQTLCYNLLPPKPTQLLSRKKESTAAEQRRTYTTLHPPQKEAAAVSSHNEAVRDIMHMLSHTHTSKNAGINPHDAVTGYHQAEHQPAQVYTYNANCNHHQSQEAYDGMHARMHLPPISHVKTGSQRSTTPTTMHPPCSQQQHVHCLIKGSGWFLDAATGRQGRGEPPCCSDAYEQMLRICGTSSLPHKGTYGNPHQ
jgi:hypothetical protein